MSENAIDSENTSKPAPGASRRPLSGDTGTYPQGMPRLILRGMSSETICL